MYDFFPKVLRLLQKALLTQFLFILGLFFLIAPPALYGQTGPNTAGNESEALIRVLRERAIPFELRPLLADYGGFGSSLHVRIALQETGSDHAADLVRPFGTFVLAVPIGSDFAVETALAFIEAALEPEKLRCELLIAFLGDEKSVLDSTEFSQSSYSHRGLRNLITLSGMPGTWAVCYLDLDSPPEALLIRHGSGDYIAPLELLRPLPSLFSSHSIPASFEVRHNGLYKLGLARNSEELNLLWEGEINGLYFSSSREQNKNKIEAQDLANLLMDYAASLNLPLQNPDRHYTMFTFGSPIFFFSEKVSVIFLISSIAVFAFAFLVYSISKRIIVISRLRLFMKYSWIFLIFLPLMVLAIRGTGLFYAFLLDIFQVPIPGSDFWGSILIVLSALWLFYGLSLGLDFIRIPRKTGFYGASAIILTALGFMVAAVLDFTYTFVFLWAFFFTYLAATLKNPVLISISVFLVPLQAFFVLNNVRELRGLPIYFFIIQGRPGSWIAIFQAAILSLPIILLLKRDMIFIKLKSKLGKIYILKRLWFRFCVLFFLFGLMTLQVLSLSRDRPEQIRREIPGDGILDISLTETVFLESRIVNIRLQTPVYPLRFDLFLQSDNNETPQIFSPPMPLERLPDNSIRFILGENPPNPLELEIVLRRDFQGSLRAEAILNLWDREIEIEPSDLNGSVDNIVLVRGRVVPLTSGIPD